MTGRWWADWLIVAAAVATATGVLRRKVIRPTVRFADQVIDAIRTLREIANEFQPNHGTSLRDAIDRVDVKADRALDAASTGAVAAQAAAAMAEACGTEIQDLRRSIDRLNELHDKE